MCIANFAKKTAFPNKLSTGAVHTLLSQNVGIYNNIHTVY